MDTLLITRDDLDADGVYTRAESIDYAGHVEISADLGTVRVRGGVRATGRIRCLSGSGIKAGRSIEAGWSVVAGGSVEAGESVEAGGSVEAGWSVEAGGSVVAGGSIVARFLSVRLRIFAGLVAWRLPEPSECEVRAEIRSGTLAHGTHVAPVEVKS